MKPKQIKLIKSLYKSADYEQKEKIKECFPEVFELPETGWFKNKWTKSVYFKTGLSSGYGFLHSTKWRDGFVDTNFDTQPLDWQPATEQEVKELLIAEAKRRGVWDCPIIDPNEVKMKNDFNFDNEGFSMKYNMLHSNYGLVFGNGKWATPIEEEKTETIQLFGNMYKITLID